MKTITVVLALILLTGFSSFFQQKEDECTNTCKLALVNAEFELPYHSGVSASVVSKSIVKACGEEPSKTCEIGDPSEGGSIVYLEFASCALKAAKDHCRSLYKQSR